MSLRRGDLGWREGGAEPRRYTFGWPGDMDSVHAYLARWHLWAAIKRDATLNDDERLAQFAVIEEHIRRGFRAWGDG